MRILVFRFAATLLVAGAAVAQDGAAGSRPRFQTKDAIVVSRPARDGAQAQLQVADGVRIIDVELKTDKTTYTEGQDLIVTVRAAESGHLRLLYQNAAGVIYTLFPNQFVTNDRIEGGRSVRVMPAVNPGKPGEEVAIQIAGPNFGIEHLAAIVSNQPFADEAALREQLRSTAFAKSAAPTIEAAITKDARVVSRPASQSGAAAAGAGFARVTLTTVRK